MTTQNEVPMISYKEIVLTKSVRCGDCQIPLKAGKMVREITIREIKKVNGIKKYYHLPLCPRDLARMMKRSRV